MDLRPLGSTGIMVSPLALGTVKFGRNTGVKYPRPFAVPDDAALASLLSLAAELGFNTLDTAPAYGASEERLGRLLGAQRDRWVICTKAGEEFDGAASTHDFSPAAIAASVERSLRRLRTDRLDVVLLHCPDDDLATLRDTAALDVLQKLKEQGKVRAFGASTKTPAGAMHAALACDVVMLTYNFKEQADGPAIDAARARALAGAGGGVMVKKALLSGHLPSDDAVARVARAHHTPAPDPVELCLRVALGKAGVSTVVIGTIDPRHLDHNADAAERALVAIAAERSRRA